MNHAKSVVINTNLFLDTSIMPEMYMIAKRSTHWMNWHHYKGNPMHTRFEQGYNPKKIAQKNQLWGMKACLGEACLGGTRK